MAGLSNADFRQIFSSVEVDRDAEDKKRKGGDKGGDKHKKKFKPSTFKKPLTAEEEKDKWRDRAKERRLGASEDYQISEEAVKGLTIEESKYLGGDMEHTHLVKGLDFALLAKVRSEMEEKQSEIESETGQAEAKARIAEAKNMATKSVLGKMVQEHLLAASLKSKQKLEFFLPGRSTFVFDIDNDFGSDLPTTVSRSLDDLKYSLRDKRTANISKNIMTSIQTIMSYIRQGSKPAAKKMKRKEHKEEKPAAKPVVVPDEDIFDDAGTYDLGMRAEEKAKDAAKK